MRIHSFLVVAAVAGIGLASCAGGSGQTSKRLGLTSGPLPTPQPFVTQSRTSQPNVYPRIGALPPPRSDQILSMSERKALEASLLATPGRQPSPDFEDGLLTELVADALIRSGETGAWEKVG